ncbi:hypothetical protein BRADI_2g43167v3 [Brachypodium distachyon]|uniref:Histidine-containing phosphotransfer protein n=1 Tax=Brachypodium distachyon TaxID=15368 RepID=A0A2K2DDL9_BRADI|nr:hypothetical protein BRADI_2g43167v3 [Brachypodium distachyon]
MFKDCNGWFGYVLGVCCCVWDRDKPCVDFDRLDAIAHRFKGSSASVGALRVKNTCIQLHVFCKEKSLNGCLMTLNTVSNEFYNMRGKFQMILQLEQQVKTYYSKK